MEMRQSFTIPASTIAGVADCSAVLSSFCYKQWCGQWKVAEITACTLIQQASCAHGCTCRKSGVVRGCERPFLRGEHVKG